VLYLSEHAEYGRIEAARAATRFPRFLEFLASGALTLTAVTLIAPHLTEENHPAVLESARHKTAAFAIAGVEGSPHPRGRPTRRVAP
jgi:hypothetical protein